VRYFRGKMDFSPVLRHIRHEERQNGDNQRKRKKRRAHKKIRKEKENYRKQSNDKPQITEKIRKIYNELEPKNGAVTKNRLILMPNSSQNVETAGLFNLGKRSDQVFKNQNLNKARGDGNLLGLLQGPDSKRVKPAEITSDTNKENIDPSFSKHKIVRALHFASKRVKNGFYDDGNEPAAETRCRRKSTDFENLTQRFVTSTPIPKKSAFSLSICSSSRSTKSSQLFELYQDNMDPNLVKKVYGDDVENGFSSSIIPEKKFREEESFCSVRNDNPEIFLPPHMVFNVENECLSSTSQRVTKFRDESAVRYDNPDDFLPPIVLESPSLRTMLNLSCQQTKSFFNF
jgi:hypothetical protein